MCLSCVVVCMLSLKEISLSVFALVAVVNQEGVIAPRPLLCWKSIFIFTTGILVGLHA